MEFRGLLLAVVLIIAVGICEGRKCWFCMNARSNAECLSIGHVQQCLVNQEYCQNEVRAIAGGKYFEVTKRCKKDLGCSNNERQNFTGTYPFQCATELPHSVCRCCCGFDQCNQPEVSCLQEKPECPPIVDPENGYSKCQGPPYTIESRCLYFCNIGYQLEGDDSATCIFDGASAVWSTEPPKCVVKPCEPPHVDPDDGSVDCTDSNNIGSVCTFTCDPGYVLIGSEKSECSVWSLWTKDAPECKIVPCLPPKPRDVNRVETCTDAYNTGSTCDFECKDGYTLTGAEEVICELIVGTQKSDWNERAGTCEPTPCPDLVPTNAVRVCTDGNNVGSECSYTCREGEYMVDSDGSLIQSGRKQIVCELITFWSSGPPDCRPISCIDLTAPTNGGIDCSSGSDYDSTCSFTCDSAYDLVGFRDTTCVDDKNGDEIGRWTREKPTCQRGQCPRITETDLITCTEGNLVGSICTIRCNPGEYMTDNDGNLILETVLDINCQVDRTWSDEIPQCRPITCVPPQSAPGNGFVSCSDGNNFNSQCSFSCAEKFELEGSPSTLCEDDGNGDEFGQWSQPPPVCTAKSCDPLREFVGVDTRCSDDNLIGSTCTFRCEGINKELVGTIAVTCIEGDPIPVWNDTANPSCRDLSCPSYPEEGKFPRADVGSIVCSPLRNKLGDRWKVGSQCDLTCEEGYQAKNNLITTDCLRSELWSVPDLCCVECVVNLLLDVVTLIDGSYADKAIWDMQTNFLVDFADFIAADFRFNLNITVMPYADVLDTGAARDLSRTGFTEISAENPASRLRSRLNNMAFAGSGDSNLGEALRYVQEEIFKPEMFTPNRVPMVFIITTAAPDDIALARQKAAILRNDKVHIRIFPIQEQFLANAGTNSAIYEELTGNELYVFEEFEEELFYDTAAEELITVTKRLCNDLTQGSQACLFA